MRPIISGIFKILKRGNQFADMFQMKTKKQFFLSFVVWAMFASCNEASMSGNSAKAAKEKNTPDDDLILQEDPSSPENKIDKGQSNLVQETQSFTAESSKSPLDIVWVIDNSGSMKEEIEQVEKNLNQFVATVSNSSDLRIAMISKFCVDQEPNSWLLCIKLDGNAVRKVDVVVGSTNALAILTAAQTPQSDFKVDKNGTFLTVKGKIYEAPVVSGAFWTRIESPKVVELAAGSLLDFWRSEATRVVIVVSDDENRALSVEQYLDVTNQLGFGAFKMFGFVGVGNANPVCNSIKSETYPILAAKTGGAVYDICEKDWSGTFEKLTEAVVRSTGGTFKLKFEAANQDITVTIDNVKLEKNFFKLRGQTLTIEQNHLKADSEIVVVYDRLVSSGSE